MFLEKTMMTTEERIINICSSFTNATRFSYLLNGLNSNDEYPKLTKPELQKILKKMVEEKQISRYGNTNAYMDFRGKTGGRYGK